MRDERSASALGAPRLSERELRRLLEVGRALVSELDLEAVLRQVLDTARDLTRARYAALGIIDRSGEELERFLFWVWTRPPAGRSALCRADAVCSAS
jgi:GAF domain-containing protein